MIVDDWVSFNKDDAHIKKEREKARLLKKTQWWQTLLIKGVCHYCKKKFPPEELTIDHILPLARGGKSTKGNCVPSCLACNQKKKHLTPVEQILNQIQNEKKASS